MLDETRPPAVALDVDVVCASGCLATRTVLYRKPRENAEGAAAVDGTNRLKGLALVGAAAAAEEAGAKFVAKALEAEVEFSRELRGTVWNVELLGSAELEAATQW